MMITSAEEFKRYVESEIEDENAKAFDPAPDDVWFDVLLKYPELSRDVVFNHTISVDVLERLCLCDDMHVRWEIAIKRRINRAIFEQLARDKSIIIRHRIACNPKAPEDILAQLAGDEDPIVSEAARKRIGLKSNRA
ncbi:hypothetical protein BW687_012335 [Pseudomonas graminis]|uniref:hypothetical protein n=1 Tax=Pseudomonas graminis TaxID=158627 RepID=UPI001F1440D5|nr:hypothetical protein [Pseudomonas graminis]MDC6380958.1 hypothetical protein [Pseudomonas graminis]